MNPDSSLQSNNFNKTTQMTSKAATGLLIRWSDSSAGSCTLRVQGSQAVKGCCDSQGVLEVIFPAIVKSATRTTARAFCGGATQLCVSRFTVASVAMHVNVVPAAKANSKPSSHFNVGSIA
jgi:hypothetical protein